MKKGYWFFGIPKYRNDPFDCCIEIYKTVIGIDLNEQEEERLQKFGACCFTKSPTNLHLWSLYAGSHSGFVLEFEFTASDYVNMTSKGINIPVLDITYSENIPASDSLDFKEIQTKRYFKNRDE